MFCWHTCMCIACMPGAYWGQKMDVGSFGTGIKNGCGLPIQVLGLKPRSSGRTASSLNNWTIFQSFPHPLWDRSLTLYHRLAGWPGTHYVAWTDLRLMAIHLNSPPWSAGITGMSHYVQVYLALCYLIQCLKIRLRIESDSNIVLKHSY